MSKTVLEDVKEKIKEIEDKRVLDKLKMQEALAKSKAEEEEARKALGDAASALDVDAYGTAAERESRAHSLVQMYEEKSRQLKAQGDISEKESDRIIDNLLAYSESLDADFTEALKKKAEELQKMQDAYTAEAQEIERTINYWCDHIHANYNTRGRSTYYVDGKPTHRSPEPVPVIMRRGPWSGCKASNALQTFLHSLDSNAPVFDGLGGGAAY